MYPKRNVPLADSGENILTRWEVRGEGEIEIATRSRSRSRGVARIILREQKEKRGEEQKERWDQKYMPVIG